MKEICIKCKQILRNLNKKLISIHCNQLVVIDNALLAPFLVSLFTGSSADTFLWLAAVKTGGSTNTCWDSRIAFCLVHFRDKQWEEMKKKRRNTAGLDERTNERYVHLNQWGIHFSLIKTARHSTNQNQSILLSELTCTVILTTPVCNGTLIEKHWFRQFWKVM